MIKTPEQIESEVSRIVGRGLWAAGLFLQARMRELVSVPAPRKRVKTRAGGFTWRARTPATPGAPPRKITGSFRSKIMVRKLDGWRVQIGVFSDVRARPFETWMRHPFLYPTLRDNMAHVARIIGDSATTRRRVT